jgi:hypothetical protein
MEIHFEGRSLGKFASNLPSSLPNTPLSIASRIAYLDPGPGRSMEQLIFRDKLALHYAGLLLPVNDLLLVEWGSGLIFSCCSLR